MIRITNDSLSRRFELAAITVLYCWMCVATIIQAEEPRLFARPVAVMMSDDGDSVFIANRDLPTITVINCDTLESRIITGHWSGILDAALLPESKQLIAVSATPPSLLAINTVPLLETGPSLENNELTTIALTAKPAKVAVSLDGKFACASMTWDHSVLIIPFNDDHQPEGEKATPVSLSFPPKELLALPDEKFLVADAFGGQLAVIDGATSTIIAAHELPCHHIGGMTRQTSKEQILITHQQLSKIAETSRDDLHWGNLMQSGVTSIPEAGLFNGAKLIDSNLHFHPLGDVGNGAADPAGIASWNQRDFAVAVAGTNQVAFWNHHAKAPMFVDVGLMPTRLIHFGTSQLLCINTLDDTASLVDFSNGMRVKKCFGSPRTLQTPEERGETAFYFANLSHDGWMSCSSCHVDGHSPGLLADTMGDGRFGNPKRIPSLLNASITGPWGWNGNKPSLEIQIQQTLQTTMHRDERSRTSGSNDDDTAKDITAYLHTLSTPNLPKTGAAEVVLGEISFLQRGCIKCHDPDQHYTSPGIYDVSVHDETGVKLFNPPSLTGLRHRRAYFHDARFRSLDDVLKSHPGGEVTGSPEDQSNLNAFLMTL
ncbi:MAG: hypothetical protein O2856_00625 [Planctomycetota bacterium]|nr:hypothetical protein [Planctomycetota bacterium]